MRTWEKAVSSFLVLVMLLSLLPLPEARAAETASASGSGITITQSAKWSQEIPGNTVVDITVEVTSDMDLQKPKDVVLVIDCAASQDLSQWKAAAMDLVSLLSSVPGMRYALVSYETTAKKVEDFTDSSNTIKIAVNRLQSGANSNAYGGLKLAQELIQNREDKTRNACVVLLSTAKFNMNLYKTGILGRELKASVPVYGINGTKYHPDYMYTVCTSQLSVQEMAMEIGESRRCSNAVVTVRPGAPFTLTGGDGTDGTRTFSIPDFQMGRSYSFHVSGKLKDRASQGTLTASEAASISGSGLETVFAGPVDVTRSALSVTYNANGGTGSVPVDNGRYNAGDTVTVKPASLSKQGWNFSGWTHPTLNLERGSFPITTNTTLDASWGRAFVKLSSSTVSTNIQGTQMLSKKDIKKKYTDGAFYNRIYSEHISSINLRDSVNIHADAVAAWDITDTSVPGNDEGAVMAWVVPSWEDESKYDLYIGGRGGLTAPADCSYLFERLYVSKFNGLTILDTSNVTTMQNMFDRCSMATLDLTGWKTSNVTNMDSMFLFCSNMEQLTGIENPETWNMSNVTEAGSMFYGCKKLKSLDVRQWDTSKINSFYCMFRECEKLTTLDLSKWNTSQATCLDCMFYNCLDLRSLDLHKGETSWDTSKVVSTINMFYRCQDLKDLNLTDWNVQSLKNTSSMFENYGLNVKSIDLHSWKNTGEIENMERMFSGCGSLETVNLTGWNTPKVKNVKSMFSSCGYKTSSLGLKDLDLSGWTVGTELTDTSYMFTACYALKTLKFPNKWNTAKVTTMESMFSNCQSMTSSPNGINDWNTSSVTNMKSMFDGCKALTTLNLNKWNTGTNMKKVLSLEYMFRNCAALTSIGTSTLTVAPSASAKSLLYGANSNLKITVKDTNGVTIDTGSMNRSISAAPQLAADLSAECAEDTETDQILSQETAETPSQETVETPSQETQELPPEDAGAASDENTPPPEDVALSASLLHSAARVNRDALDLFGRPLYACTKAGLWNCGRVEAGQTISYALELQYLDENLGRGGSSGQLTVTNPIPEGLTYNGDARISAVRRIVSGDGGRTGGEILQNPEVTNGVLTFTVIGLSAGAKYVVTYSCTTPNPGPAEYTEFLNTASVVDSGLADEADPVLHYMNEGGPAELCAVTYSYENPPVGAVPPLPETCDKNTEITLPAPAGVEGYSFDGWKENGTGTATPGGALYSVTGNTRFVGTWTKTAEEPRMVRLDYSFDETRPMPENADLILEGLLDGVQLELPENTNTSAPRLTTPPEGWAFQWRFPDGLNVDQNDGFNTGRADDWPSGVITIIGEWAPAEYPVTYQWYNEYSAPYPPPPLPQVSLHPRGSLVPLAPNPANVLVEYPNYGTILYTFKGWTGVETDPNGRFTMPAEPVVIIGDWAEQWNAPQEVLISPNGGLWRKSAEEELSDEDVILSLEDYEKLKEDGIPEPENGNIPFLRWEESDDPDGVFSKLVTAMWNTFTVTFDDQGHGRAPDPITNLESGAKITAPAPAPSAPGYTFGGWFKEPDCTNAWDFDTDTVTADTTLYAKWTAAETFTVTFDVQGHGTTPDPVTGLVSGAKVTKPTDPKAEGWGFLGWYREPACTTPWDFAANTIEGNTTLYAKWEKVETFTVTFDIQGHGTAPAPATGLLTGDKVPKPADPAAAGWKFLGWYTEPDGGTAWDFAADTVSKDMTLYAKWEVMTYQISGTVLDPDGNPIVGAEVKIVHEGAKIFMEKVTGSDGRYTVTGVPNGIYNTVASYGTPEVTTTILSIISGRDLDQTIRFAKGNTNSVLKVTGMPDETPYIVTGGLEKEAASVREENKDAGTVEVKMDVVPADRIQKQTEIQKIQTAAEAAVKDLSSQTPLQTHVDLVLDIGLTKEVTDAGTEKITSAANVLELVIPYPMEGKANILVHRFHDTAEDREGAATFTRLEAKPENDTKFEDKTFYLDTANNLIHVYAQKFSLYAVSYTTEGTETPPVNPPAPSGGGGGGGGSTAYIITASAGSGGSLRPAGKVRVSAGASQSFTVTPEPGFAVRDVLVDGSSVGAVTTYTFRDVRANHTIEAFFAPDGKGLLNTVDHRDYLHGFRDGLFRPNAPMTRGQAAQMFFNLLRDQEIPGGSAFVDVPGEMWCYEAVSALKNLGIMVGVTEERFEPNRPITRGELVVTAVRFTEHAPSNACPFTDVRKTDWYYPQISAAAARGWISGYPDGTFRPNSPITRGQAAVVINCLLGRQGDRDFIDSRPAGLRDFPDTPANYWAYYDVMESANAHDYLVQGERERWSRLR